MKKFFLNRRSDPNAFTLIELLIVVAIIAILAAMLIPIMGRISVTRMKAVAKAELNQIATAIDHYKGKYGFYPPDNATNTFANPLYFELVGTILTNDTTRGGYGFLTLDRTCWMLTNAVRSSVGVSGFANSSSSPLGSDDRPAPMAFLKGLKPSQIGSVNGGTNLLCSQEWTKPGATAGQSVNPWRYNSSHPTNNPSSYDLWVDLYIDGKTNRISNWNKQPQIVW